MKFSDLKRQQEESKKIRETCSQIFSSLNDQIQCFQQNAIPTILNAVETEMSREDLELTTTVEGPIRFKSTMADGTGPETLETLKKAYFFKEDISFFLNYSVGRSYKLCDVYVKGTSSGVGLNYYPFCGIFSVTKDAIKLTW